jgi:hypothetical protein
MTPEKLEEKVLTLDQSINLAAAFAGLDEKQRAKLSSTAQKLLRQLADGKANADSSDLLKRYLAQHKGGNLSHWNRQANRNAALAVFAVGPLSAVKKWQARTPREDAKALRKIIRDRKPDWLEEWIEHELDQDWTSLEFETIQTWVKDGICAKPETDGYYRLFAHHMMRTGFYGRQEEYVPPLSEQLLKAPELIPDIDGLFRVETNAFNTNAWLTKGAPAHYETWPQALIKLSHAGHLERAHLLRLALDGLRLVIKQNQLSGYHKFYRAMEPTAAELIDHQPDYIELLCHPVSHVAKFAIDMLAKVEKAKALQREPFLREVGTVFAGEAKGNAIAALKLLQRIVAPTKKAPDPAALTVIIEALRHTDPEVQANAIGMLEPHSKHLSAEQFAALEDMVVLVSASNRPALESLLPNGVGAATSPSPSLMASGLSDGTVDYKPFSFSDGCRGVLDEADAITPIASVDELIDTVFHAIEVVDSPDELERIIDAISRLADQRPADFDQRVAPLLHRLNKGQVGSNGLGAGRIGLGLAVLDLVATWASGTLYRTPEQFSEYSTRQDAFVPMAAHVREISTRVVAREAKPLLAAPTHRGGWIDPVVWVRRIAKMERNSSLERSIDVRLAMLRLAPDNRTEALQLASDLGGDIGRLARFALGGIDRPQKSDRSNYAAWITAARCREPGADWSSEFASLALDDAWPDSLFPAVHEWSSSHKAGQYEQMRWKHPELKVRVRTDGRVDDQEKRGLLATALGKLGGRTITRWEELPTAALCRRTESKHYWSMDLNTTWLAQWLAYLWPQKLDSAHMKAAAKLAQRMDEDSSNWTPNYGFLHALFQRGRPWGEPGHLVLALSLVGKDADVRGLAIDALIEGIENRIFDPVIFAIVMTRLCEGEWVKYNRLGENLLQVAQVSPAHARAIDAALQAWLPDFDLTQRNGHHVLQVLVETQAISGASISLSTRTVLTSLTGKTKAASLAKQVLG